MWYLSWNHNRKNHILAQRVKRFYKLESVLDLCYSIGLRKHRLDPLLGWFYKIKLDPC